ncbi:MAG: TRAP transporter small permease [Gracilibacteraceae bacterium]|jgi:C4-dicarboxylate transporter DctQ subunit|nr:TRAP transporter small permease [Gracilibacteraceae bacterium]
MKILDKIILFFEEYFLCLLFILMPVICFFQVLCRYALHLSAPWTEETMRALFVWATFIGASLGVKYGSHLGVTAIVNLFPYRMRTAFQALIYLACTCICLFLTYSSLKMVINQTVLNQLLPVTRLPVGLTTACMPVGFALMSIRFLMRAVGEIQAISHPPATVKEEL